MEKWLRDRETKDALATLSATPPTIMDRGVVDDPIKASLDAKLNLLRQRIAQLKEEASVRSNLRSESESQIDYQITQAVRSLEEFSMWGIGYNQGVDFKRNFLERQLAQFRRERRELRVRAWEHMVSVRREIREAVAEYYDLLRRYRLLGYER